MNVLLHDPVAIELALCIREARTLRHEMPAQARLMHRANARCLARLRASFRRRQRRYARRMAQPKVSP
jgi:hypothetical protein